VTELPEGFGLDLDRSVRTFDRGRVLVGGQPGRLITLSSHGVTALDSLIAGRPVPVSARQLGARLVEGGLAHPRSVADPPEPATQRQVTVVVPAKDRVADLDRCLGSLGGGPHVVVVDDGSDDPESVTRVCERHGTRLIRSPVNRGPAAARNDALTTIDTELVAFVDSDCSVAGDWLAPLVRHLEDPGVGAVAPRVRPAVHGPGPGTSALDRYSEARSALDLGPDPSEVGPGRLVRYVPTVALVARTAALTDGFDPDLRVGEDVDLVWRLVTTGWRVRYEPSVTVRHHEPDSWWELLARRFRYGTSAGPLAKRHRALLAPIELRPWPTAVAAAIFVGRPRTALVALVASTLALHRSLGRHGIPVGQTLRWSAGGAGWTVVGIGRAATLLAWPALVSAGLRSKRARLACALMVLAPPVVDWWHRRPRLDLLRWVVASVADDVAYGAGVWEGCLSARTIAPLIPSFRRSGVEAGD
jgi:mycofactocin system glycosyltransferase